MTHTESAAARAQIRRWGAFVIGLALLFVKPLAALAVHAYRHDLHSHILLVPFISAYLLYSQRRSLPAPGRRSTAGTALLAGAGIAAASAGIAWRGSLSVNDCLALMTLAFVSLVAAGGFLFLGREWMAAAAFPLAFLIFMVPMPGAVEDWLERASSLASAEAAALYFTAAGTTMVRHGTVFELPGIVLEVGQECSGIRSSWVLFITSVLASHLFLGNWRNRLTVVALVIPLGILRNGFRVFVIGQLCIRIGPHMIDSIIHHRGGPLFFALSLVPLFLLVWWLRRRERRAGPPG